MKNPRSRSANIYFRVLLGVIFCLSIHPVYAAESKQGKTPEQEFKEAKADALKGDAAAQFALATCYAYGKGVAQNGVEAAKWYRKAADQDYVNAQYSMGWCYQNGEGVDGSTIEAVKWYRKAAEKGHVLAQYSLGWCCQNGSGMEKNLAEAVKWYTKAAEQGHPDAQYSVAWCYGNGQGVATNRVEAYKWAVLAAGEGFPDARKLRDEMERHLKPDQIAEARKAAETLKSRLSPQ
jgi:uncharacterized protein